MTQLTHYKSTAPLPPHTSPLSLPFHFSSLHTELKRKKKMSSVCISNCVSDARVPRVPVRATYMNLYKWPESDAEFVRRRRSHVCGHPRVVDSVSCRQMYLRSYKFSRKETVPERTQKCFGKVKERVKGRSHHKGNGFVRRRKCLVWRKMREISRAALFMIFRRFLSCGATVDVVQTKS
ncbi:uncharacterized protein LOC106770254 [Vigna radiata var. radiata]|uniref:Uncharacterized protein LOC106770254 n=1 Tax=Vigna radiata var. radiata TaxID=3916 RepID=A0A1S3UZS4_VIGRR|nr:uncharacterized protein LOC106770254 [Vigna radiata var. radiata]